MAKKKKEAKAETLAETIGFKNVFKNDRVKFLIGIVFLFIAFYLSLAFISFFTTGKADQSIMENMRNGDMVNETQAIKNYCGSLGAKLSQYFMKDCFGIAAFVIPFFLLIAGLKMTRIYSINLLKWFLCDSIVMIWTSVAFAKFLTPLFSDSHFNPGGGHGLYISNYLENIVGTPGLTVILAFVAVAFLTYLSAETITFIRKILGLTGYIGKVKDKTADLWEKRKNNTDSKEEEEPETQEDKHETLYEKINSRKDDSATDGQQPDDSDEDEAEDDDAPGDDSTDDAEDNSIDLDITDIQKTLKSKDTDTEMEVTVAQDGQKADNKTLVSVGGQEMEPYDPKRDLENYHYPTLDLLKKYETDGKAFVDKEELEKNKNRIIEVLHNFGVDISSIRATVGPTITLYEITPATGVRISRIRSLEDDIALSLSAIGIRIIAPIPGKGTVGIEVPNEKPQIVSMESILNSKKFEETTMELPIALGKTITNDVFMADLAKIPHLLVAGATGQGKSVGLNAIITSLLYKKHPAELKLVLVDPKKVEFSIYTPLANHFLAALPEEDDEPIITDVTKVVRTLNSLCKEMDTRYDLLKKAGARNLKEYNTKFKARQLNPDNGHKFMPYIVVIIDEFGDLIMTAGKEIELPIARIAQLARAVGIHMVIATQRPTTNIITGTIKANFPGRMAFKVSAMIDSRTILDRPGANQLIGRGDMLILNGNEPVRVQCAFVDTPEVERINNYIAKQQSYLHPFELPEPDTDAGMEDMGGGNAANIGTLDPLFEDAARLIVVSQQGSTSLLQRKFEIGYNRAGRLMDQLEKAGIVGQIRGSKPREVLITDENSLAQLISNLR